MLAFTEASGCGISEHIASKFEGLLVLFGYFLDRGHRLMFHQATMSCVLNPGWNPLTTYALDVNASQKSPKLPWYGRGTVISGHDDSTAIVHGHNPFRARLSRTCP
jgi:hypothetical protein